MIAGERLRRRRRAVYTTMGVGIAVCVGGAVIPVAVGAPPGAWWIVWLGLAGFGVAWLAAATGTFIFHCPGCGANLSNVFLYAFGVEVQHGVRFCPYCGCDFDDTDG